jgi:uncharacterized SAM-binding protein YcdF (DUF218 family)
MLIKTTILKLKRLVKWKGFMVALGVLLLLLVGLSVLYRQVDARSRVDAARSADVIVVLGSAVWPGERPSPSLNARIQHAIGLYCAGFAPALILSGGLGNYAPTEAEMMRRIAAGAGVPADALILEDASHSTEENLANAKALMDVRGWRRAIIVSDPFHLLRAELMARDLGIDAYGSGASTSPTYTAPPLHFWYTSREALALVWYYATRLVGEPTWLYEILKGKV